MMSNPQAPLVDIIIPTFNRSHQVATAVRSALEQSWWNLRVTVVDDGSTDKTRSVLERFFDRPDFNYIGLERNLGTAKAKNVGLLLTGGDAVTFHDSDDIPHRDKVLRQVRMLTAQEMTADACLNWPLAGRSSGSKLSVGAVFVHHELIMPDGRRIPIRRDLSLLDDVFPNLQLGSGIPGEWTHINSGLFHADAFSRLGGFADCIEEDREFRNRLILSGEIVRIIPEILLTKIETADSLTQSTVSDYQSQRRATDRRAVWDKVEHWRKTGEVQAEPLHLPDLNIGFISNPSLLTLRAMPCVSKTRNAATELLRIFQQNSVKVRVAE